MKNKSYIFNEKKNKYIEATKWDLFWHRFKHKFTKWKLIDTSKYCLLPWNDKKKQFSLSNKEYEDAKKLYEEKGTISYEFYPCGGIGWGIKIHILKTKEIIDITDVTKW